MCIRDRLNLDPDFRIGDQAELKLMLKDALAQVFEDNYARAVSYTHLRLANTRTSQMMTRLSVISVSASTQHSW